MAVATRGRPRDASEGAREVARGLKAHRLGHCSDRQLARRQQYRRLIDPAANDESVRGHARALLEESREIVGAHVHDRAQFGERQLTMQVSVDVLRHPPEPRLGQASGRHGNLPIECRLRVSCRVFDPPRCRTCLDRRVCSDPEAFHGAARSLASAPAIRPARVLHVPCDGRRAATVTRPARLTTGHAGGTSRAAGRRP